MREFFTIAIFKIKADIRMNKTTLNSQKEKHSTLSLRRATSLGLLSLKPHTHFYPRSPCGERPLHNVNVNPLGGISIHALLAESDVCPSDLRTALFISIHALLAESAPSWATRARDAQPFLSTLSLRRAAIGGFGCFCFGSDFYPHSPCGERHDQVVVEASRYQFLSTLSLRRATAYRPGLCYDT